MLSDSESAGAESETDYSDLDIDVRAKSDPDGDGFGSGAAPISDRLVTDHQDDNNHSKGVVDKTQLRLSTGSPRSASPDSASDTHQASKLHTDVTQESTSSFDLDVTKEWEDEGFDAYPEGADKDDGDTCSTKGRTLSAFPNKNPVCDSNISGPQDSQPDDIQSKQLALAAASPHQSDLKNGYLAKKLHRGATRNVRSKRPRITASIGLAGTARTASASLESSPSPQPRAQITGPDQEMADDGGTDDSNDEDYDDMSDSAASVQCPLYSRKRVKRAKDMEANDSETSSTCSLNVSHQATAASSSISIQESEEIPIHGYLTLKTFESKLQYCLTFSQECLSELGGTSQRERIPKSVVLNSRDKRNSERVPMQERATSIKNARFSSLEDDLLLTLKGEGLSWDEISDYFPNRSKGTLQVRYCTKLNPCPRKSTNTKKRQRFG